jgi:hypothetical protein
MRLFDRQGRTREGTRVLLDFIPDGAGGGMGRRVNYGFEKRQREIKKQKKNEEKAEKKLQEARERADEPGAAVPGEDVPDGE